MPTREEALERFIYRVSHDFHGPNQEAPTWAEGNPKQWGDEDDCIKLQLKDPGTSTWNRTFRRHGSAISSDEKLLAAMDENGILVYDIETKEYRQRIRDGEHPIKGLWFTTYHKSSGYELVCYRESARGSDGTIEIYHLDQHGRLVHEDPPLDTRGLAVKAFDSIRKDLVDTYLWTDDSMQPLDIAEEFQKVLDIAEKRHASRGKLVIQGSGAGFGSMPFDSTGRFMLFRHNNTTTQHGMRAPEKLPHVIVFDLIEKKEVLRLGGHTDSIMWLGYNHDNSKIASVSWDGSARTYHSTTGELAWKTDSGGGQAWAASWSPDSKYIVISSGKGRNVTVHSSEDGNIVARLDNIEIHDWVRNLAWRPTGDYAIALSQRRSVYIWRPFEPPDNQVQQMFAIDEPDDGFRSFMTLQVDWLDNGKKVIVKCSDGSLEIWDIETNMKWRMLKPQGLVVAAALEKRHVIREMNGKKMLLSTDGDGVVRFWPLV